MRSFGNWSLFSLGIRAGFGYTFLSKWVFINDPRFGMNLKRRSYLRLVDRMHGNIFSFYRLRVFPELDRNFIQGTDK